MAEYIYYRVVPYLDSIEELVQEASELKAHFPKASIVSENAKHYPEQPALDALLHNILALADRTPSTIIVYSLNRLTNVPLGMLLAMLSDWRTKGVTVLDYDGVTMFDKTKVYGDLLMYLRHQKTEGAQYQAKRQKAEGKVVGRKRADIDVSKLRKLRLERKWGYRAIAKELGVSKATIIRECRRQGFVVKGEEVLQ